MSKEGWIEVGLRLLGVYFIVIGVLAVLQTGIGLFIARHTDVLGGILLIVPAVEVLAGTLLLYIKWRRE